MDEQELTPETSRRRLGRGLNALLGTGSFGDDPSTSGNESSEVHVDLIERNPFQPRQEFEASALNELADSIRTHGVLQPLLVRQTGDTYQLIAGERRLMAAKKAGLEIVPCRVLSLTDQQVCEVSLEENLKRQDLNVLEKARAFQDYINRFQCPIEELGRRLSLDRSTVSNMLRLLELPAPIQTDLLANKITAGHARAILSLDEPRQLAMCDQIQKQGLSVRKTEEAVRALLSEPNDTIPFPTGGDKPARSKPEMTAHVQSLQDQLRDMLAAKVEIKLKGKEAGKIVIEFTSNDEFERLLGKLRRAA